MVRTHRFAAFVLILGIFLLLGAGDMTDARSQDSPPADHSPAHTDHHASPYAHQADSGIAGLSAAERTQLEEGHGMGLARPAELNSYPGPKHVLELADELGLTEEQITATQAAFDRMANEAKRLGAEIVEREEHLDLRFQHHHINAEVLREATDEIGALHGQLRYTHLAAHLEMVEVLTAEQIARYDELRGYGDNGSEMTHDPSLHQE